MSTPGLTQTVAPAAEPIVLSQVKAYLGVDVPDTDTMLTDMIARARSYVEAVLERQLMPATYQLSMDSFPPFDMSVWLIRQPRPYLPQTRQFQGSGGGTIRLPRPPCTGVTSIRYLDPTDQTAQGTYLALDLTTTVVDLTTEPARLTPAYGQVWPVSRFQVAAVLVTYTAGYAAGTIPGYMLDAIYKIVAHWYENREALSPFRLYEVPHGIDDLLGLGWDGEYV
jgi:hypothetical protein